MTPSGVTNGRGRSVRVWGLLVAVALLSGCAGPVGAMREMPAGQAPPAPGPGQAMVVFLRPSTLSFAIASSVFELKPGGDRFVGSVPAKKMVAYVTDAGPTRFMVVSEAADFMAADLEAGKTYYALVTPRVGMWKARFSLRPVHRNELEGEEFRNTEASHAWAKHHWSDVQDKKVEYLQKGEPRTDKPTLSAADGR